MVPCTFFPVREFPQQASLTGKNSEYPLFQKQSEIAPPVGSPAVFF